MSGTGDKGHDAHISEADVERIYQALPKARAGAHLDRRLLQASRRARTPWRAYPWRWQRPLAMAASVILCVGLVSFYYLEPGVMPTGSRALPEQAVKPMPAKQHEAFPANTPVSPSVAIPAEEAIGAGPESHVASPMLRQSPEPRNHAQEPRGSYQDQPLTKTGKLDTERGRVDSISTLRRHEPGADTKARLRQAPAVEKAAEKPSVQGLSSDALKPATISPTYPETAPIETAQAMLSRIRKLNESGQHEAAIRLWREFRQRYPDYPRAGIEAILGRDWGQMP